MLQPIVVPSNRPPERFYRGGLHSAEFRGDGRAPEREPEDWVGSTTTLSGESALGLTTLPDGRLLTAAIAEDPEGWLGADHLKRHGIDTMLLVKLLDAGQRLPVHAHPDRAWARAHVGRMHGKAEAWYILRGGTVHVGLRRDTAPADLRGLVDAQDTEALLEALNPVPVSPADVVFVPAGVLHSIGEGIFLVELQEPEDLSIVLEWRGFDLDGERDGHLGVGFDVALGAVELRARDAADLVRPAGYGGSVLPTPADPFFRLERAAIHGDIELEAGFAILIVTDGAVRLTALDLPRGSTVVVPHAAGPFALTGQGEVLVARPPAAPAAEATAGILSPQFRARDSVRVTEHEESP